MRTTDTFTAVIHIAGDVETAKRWIRRYCYEHGFCVTVTPSTFIYTGGEETGFQVGLVNYPRFPTPPDVLEVTAVKIARALMVECCQKTALVVMPTRTVWISEDPPGMRR